jgi:hypothetical protein
MAQTRAQEKAAAAGETPEIKPQPKTDTKTKATRNSRAKKEKQMDKGPASRKPPKSVPEKRTREEDTGGKNVGSKPKATKKSKVDDTSSEKPATPSNIKVAALLSKYGAIPLQNTELPDPSSPTPETLLVLVFNAMLTSARISHQLAARSVRCLIEAGYHDIKTLKNSSWEERTEVLTKGGYTHYREKTATMLGELADLVLDKYGMWCRIVISCALLLGRL